MMIRKIVGPPVALGGIALFGCAVYDYFFDPASKTMFFDFLRGDKLAALLISVGMSWTMGKFHGQSTTDEHARKDGGASDQST